MTHETTPTVQVGLEGQKKDSCGGYYCCDTKQINMLLVGRSQSGKSSLLQALHDPEHIKPRAGLSTTRNSQLHRTILFDEAEKKSYMLHVIDTPGLKEVNENSGPRRSDNELLRLAMDCIVTSLNIVCLVSEAGKTHQQDVQVFQPILNFLGESWKDNMMMVLTHVDRFPDAKLHIFKKDIESHKLSKTTYEFCKLGVFYHGILNVYELAPFEDSDLNACIIKVKMKCLIPHGQKLFKTIIARVESPRPVIELDELTRRQKAAREDIERTAKSGQCSIS